MRDPGPCPNASQLLVATGTRQASQGLHRLTAGILTRPKALSRLQDRPGLQGSPVAAKGTAQRNAKARRGFVKISHSLAHVHPPARSRSGQHTTAPERKGLRMFTTQASWSSAVRWFSWREQRSPTLPTRSRASAHPPSAHQTCHASSGHGICQHVIACCHSPVT